MSRSHSPRLGDGGSSRCSAASTSPARSTTRSRSTGAGGGWPTGRCRTTRPALRELFTELAGHGRLLVVVDQPASIGALAIAVARSMGVEVGYLPGLAMRRIADLYPGEGKTDARDAHVIADAARTLPHALRRVGPDEQTVTALGVLAGYDADLAAESTRLTNRLHDALLHVHPALERLLGKHFRRRGVLELLAATGTPARFGARRGWAAAGDDDPVPADGAHVAGPDRRRARRADRHRPGDRAVRTGHQRRRRAAAGGAGPARDASPASSTPYSPIIRSPRSSPRCPASARGPRSRCCSRSATAAPSATAGHLAAYAGLAPVTRQSGRTISGESQPRRGNRALKSALYLSAFASLKHPTSRAYYDRKRAEGKNHTAALLCLARRRTDVLYAMVRDRRPYQHPAPQPRPEAAESRSGGLTGVIGTPLCQVVRRRGAVGGAGWGVAWRVRVREVACPKSRCRGWAGRAGCQSRPRVPSRTRLARRGSLVAASATSCR